MAYLDASIRVGKISKTVKILGDRTMEVSHAGWVSISEPKTFTSMPVSYDRAFGGPAFKKNPIGRGLEAGPMPNIEYPDRLLDGPGADVDPAGFGPTDPNWEPRRSMVGTYGADYVRERWPGFPADFDLAYFNAAPRDQQIDRYLRGDEDLKFVNLHPQRAVYESRLPGLRAKVFLDEELPSGCTDWREVPLKLDTLWVDMDAEKAVLVWRGRAEVRSLKLKEIEHIFALLEPLTEGSKTGVQYKAMMGAIIAAREKQWEDEPAESTAAEDAAIEAEFAAMESEIAEAEAQAVAAEAEVAGLEALRKAELIAQGIDPKLLELSDPPAQTASEMKKLVAAQIAQLRGIDPDQAARTEQLLVELAAAEQMEAEIAAAEAEMDAEFPPPLTRAVVAAAAAEGGNLKGQDLSELDLSGLDLSGRDLSNADLSKTRLIGSKLVGTNLRDADLSKANLSRADLTGALLDGADLTAAMLGGAKLTGMSLTGATLSRLDLPGADFSGCTGDGADFSKANLSKARFVGAKLPRADFSECKLAQANFSGAELHSARFGGALAPQINMEGANVTGLHGSDQADFTKGNFKNVNGNASIWQASVLDEADFTRAQLAGAQFSEGSLRRTVFDRADLTKAAFDDACLQDALLTNANLLRASFERADLTRASAQASNLYEAGFWETIVDQTNFRYANLKGTSLA
jgi:uncharacterized protein YjbI with pentapeptide repeats